MKFRHFLPVLALLGLTGSASAIKIEIRYDYDTNGFFNDPEARAAMEAVADFYEPLIHDSLTAIVPSGGNTWEAKFTHPGNGTTNFLVPNLVVPADTLIIFAGARAIASAGVGGFGGYNASGNTQQWFDTLMARGQAGALATPKTDFGPWGGVITFSTSLTWNFSLVDPTAGGVPFIPIALHEVGHALGLGTAPSWTAKIVNSTFTGTYASQVYGAAVPLANSGHWRDNTCGGTDGYLTSDTNKILSKAFGSFAAPHGYPQIALMDPVACTNGGYQKVMTDLDLAALRDIGWQLEPPGNLTSPNMLPSPTPYAFSWPSTTGFTYLLQRSPSLAGGTWTTLSTQVGNGSTQQFSTPAPGLTKAFYRLNVTTPAAGAPLLAAPTAPAPSNSDPVEATGCGCGAQ